MFRLLGLGLLITAALALALSSYADTGGAATATLYILGPEGPVGAAGAIEGCAPPLAPIPPPLSVLQTAGLFHDADGDGFLDPGDMVSYTAEITGFSPGPLKDLYLIVLFSPELVPEALPQGWRRLDLGRIPALAIHLPSVRSGERARVGFAARFVGDEDSPSTLFIEGLVYGPGFVLAADDPATATFLDPVAVATREVAGGVGSLFPGIPLFSKQAMVDSSFPSPRVGGVGDTVEFEVTYIPVSLEGEIEVWDLVPAPLQVLPDSLGRDTDIFQLGELTLLRTRFRDVSPGLPLRLKYAVTIVDAALVPFVSTHAMAVTESGVFFSDDPETPEAGDPTTVLFPWIKAEGAMASWREVFRGGGCSIPVVVCFESGEERLRWAVCGPVDSEDFRPGTLRFWILQVPVRELPKGALFGVLSSQVPHSGLGEIYVPAVYGLPVFSTLAGGAGFVEDLGGQFCDELCLPIVVELPTDVPPYMAGLIVDDDI